MIRWGILGAGKIAHRFCESLSRESESVLKAISCRTEEKGAAFAEKHHAERYYLDHGSLLTDPEVDAIYLALPHRLHREWAIKALRAGKAVLCEKPAALNEQEMRDIAETAWESGVLFMEAMKTRFVPLYGRLKELVTSGAIGEITEVKTSLCNEIPAQKTAFTYHREPGQGGALLDGGIYCASWLEDFLPGEPVLENISAVIRNEVDEYVDAHLGFEGRSAKLECAFDRKKPRVTVIVGTKGTIEARELHRAQSMTIQIPGKESRIIEMPYEVDDFYGQIHHFVTCLKEGRGESDVMPLAASIRCARILDVIRRGFIYTSRCLEILEEQETMLKFEQFGSEEALGLGTAIAELAREYDREISVRITRETDEAVLFQYMMDSKGPRNEWFMEGKRRAVLDTEHSSLWPYVEHKINGRWQEMFENDRTSLPAGGAFPIRVGEEQVATVAVSGLHEGKDHELVIRGLEKVLGKKVPVFPGAAV